MLTFFPVDQKDFLPPKDPAVGVKEGFTPVGEPPTVLNHPRLHQVLGGEPTTIRDDFSGCGTRRRCGDRAAEVPVTGEDFVRGIIQITFASANHTW